MGPWNWDRGLEIIRFASPRWTPPWVDVGWVVSRCGCSCEWKKLSPLWPPPPQKSGHWKEGWGRRGAQRLGDWALPAGNLPLWADGASVHLRRLNKNGQSRAAYRRCSIKANWIGGLKKEAQQREMKGKGWVPLQTCLTGVWGERRWLRSADSKGKPVSLHLTALISC